VLPFPIQIVAGPPIYEQIVHAVKLALATGRLKPGDRFPSIRTISLELGVNPNTVQKAATVLTNLGILEIRSGQGSFVAEPSVPSDKKSRLKPLEPLVKNLLIEASQSGVTDEELLTFIEEQSRKLKRL
jgi:GntR family transcriptional regulator